MLTRMMLNIVQGTCFVIGRAATQMYLPMTPAAAVGRVQWHGGASCGRGHDRGRPRGRGEPRWPRLSQASPTAQGNLKIL